MLFEGSKRLLHYGEKTSNSISKALGHTMNAFGHIAMGDIALCRKESEKAIGAALELVYSQFGNLSLGMSYFMDGQFEKAEDTFESIIDYCEKRGIGFPAVWANMFVPIILIAKGYVKQGLRKFEETQKALQKNHMKYNYAQSENILGTVYTQFITG